jgi:3-phenylpropionate/cinnamic acid dioxygenase small subunit
MTAGTESGFDVMHGTTRIRRDDPIFGVVEDFYFHEAELLDANRLTEWLELLADDVSYAMPIRTTTWRDQDSYSTTTGFLDENLGSLKTRVRRLTDSKSAWAEEPPSRARRYVTNLRCGRLHDGSIAAFTYLLLLRNRGDHADFELLSAERSDVLRQGSGDDLRLVSRIVLLDQAVVGAVNLGLFV